MGNGFHLTLMTFRQLTFELCPDDDDADKDGDDGEDDHGYDNDYNDEIDMITSVILYGNHNISSFLPMTRHLKMTFRQNSDIWFREQKLIEATISLQDD